MAFEFVMAVNDRATKRVTATDIIEASKRLSKNWLERGLPSTEDMQDESGCMIPKTTPKRGRPKKGK